jgi:peptidoglycan hydrolase-like protein with peptidoglycan-binding domain
MQKIFLSGLILLSLTHAKPYFIDHDDVCDGTEMYACLNEYNTVRNLQIVLNSEASLGLELVVDGKWGESTKNAVIAFQKKYEIKPADGWVGKTTKLKLDEVSKNILFPKDKVVETVINTKRGKGRVIKLLDSSYVKFDTFTHAQEAKKEKFNDNKAPSPASVKNYFIRHDDICEGTDTHQCKNDFNTVRNLQIALNSSKKIDVHLKEDGKWGKDTKDAVIAFQKEYGLKPADGWVGKATKIQLDKISRKIKFPKDKKQSRVSLIKTNNFGSYESFRKSVNLRKSFKVYKDKVLLSRANGRNTRLKVDVSEQRVRLYVNGKVALDSPCTTGAKHKFEPNTKIYRDKHTPLGTFKIMEKIADKRSTIFGDMYRHGKRVYHGDRRKYRGPKAKYIGASLKNWMRLTSGGIGLHASKYVKRYPGTNGCIRLPYNVAKTIFKKVRRGTKVQVVK